MTDQDRAEIQPLCLMLPEARDSFNFGKIRPMSLTRNPPVANHVSDIIRRISGRSEVSVIGCELAPTHCPERYKFGTVMREVLKLHAPCQ